MLVTLFVATPFLTQRFGGVVTHKVSEKSLPINLPFIIILDVNLPKDIVHK